MIKCNEKIIDVFVTFLVFFRRRIFKFITLKSGREINQANKFKMTMMIYLFSCGKCRVMFAVLLRLHVRAPEPKLPPLRPDGPDDLEEGG